MLKTCERWDVIKQIKQKRWEKGIQDIWEGGTIVCCKGWSHMKRGTSALLCPNFQYVCVVCERKKTALEQLISHYINPTVQSMERQFGGSFTDTQLSWLWFPPGCHTTPSTDKCGAQFWWAVLSSCGGRAQEMHPEVPCCNSAMGETFPFTS